MPRNILIISDMEFDSAVTYPGSLRRSEKGGLLSLFEQIRNEYESNGYQMPRLGGSGMFIPEQIRFRCSKMRLVWLWSADLIQRFIRWYFPMNWIHTAACFSS